MRAERIVFLAVFALTATFALAQVPTGSITGVVVDPQGLPVVGAPVIVTSQGTGTQYRTKTSSTGSYIVPSLQSGFYRVEVTVSGFRTAVITALKLDAGKQLSVPPIELEIGAVEETVVVEAGGEVVQTTSSTIATSITDVRSLPIADRAPLDLVSFMPGTSYTGRTSTHISGLRSSSVNMTLDGINIQDNYIRGSAIFSPVLPLLSQVQEFTLTGANAPSSSGLGATQVSLITPSGTNEWHGEAFWQHRNDALAANEWFNNAAGAPIPKLIQNQAGGNAGGPVFKDKLFAYGYYEFVRLSQEQGAEDNNNVVLTDNARQGLFRYLTGTDYDTGVTPLPPAVTCDTTATIIPAGTLCTMDVLAQGAANMGLISPLTVDPFVADILGQVPTTINNYDVGDSSASQLLNTAGFRHNQSDNRTRDQWGFKIDFVPSPKHSVAATYMWNRDINERPDLDDTFSTTTAVTSGLDKREFLSGAYRWSPTPSFTNEFRLGFTLAGVLFDNKFSDEYLSAGFLICAESEGGCNPDQEDGGFVFTNPINDFNDQGRDTDTYAIQDNATWVKGNHTLTFGWQSQFAYASPFTGFQVPPELEIGISGANTAGLGTGDFPGGISSRALQRANQLLASLAGFLENGYSDFNVTSRTSGFVEGAVNSRNYRLNNHSFYVGDSWRMFPTFTLNLGLRYEYMGQLCERDGLHLLPVMSQRTQQGAIDVTLDNNAVFDFAGQCGNRGTQNYDKDLNNWAPQIGIAWDPWGDGKNSIRASYSIHYYNDEAIKSPVNALRSASAGLSATAVVTDLTSTISQGVPSFPTPAVQVPRTIQDNMNDFGAGYARQTIFTIDPGLQAPYVQQWSLSVQRNVGWETIVDVSYRGNHAIGMARGLDFNQVRTNLIPGFLEDFNRARRNGFICEAAGLGFNPACTLPGSEPLTVIPNLQGGGYLTSSSRRAQIRRGEAGEYLRYFSYRGRCGTLLCVPALDVQNSDVLGNWGSSTYHAGVVEVRRNAGGLFFGGNYTFSKVLSNSSGGGVDGGGGQNKFDAHLDNAQPELDKGRALFDLTHAFKAYFNYQLPMGRGQAWSTGSWFDKVIDGWSISSTFTWQSGGVFSILSNRGTLNRAGRSTDRNTAFTTLSRDDVEAIVGLHVTPDGVFIIDPAAIGPDGRGVGDDSIEGCVPFGPAGLCNPQPGQVGNLPRRAFNGPSYFNWDFSVAQKINVTESKAVEWRFHFLNFPNHPTFYTGNQNINSSNFGVMDETLSDARVVQFALRFIF